MALAFSEQSGFFPVKLAEAGPVPVALVLVLPLLPDGEADRTGPLGHLWGVNGARSKYFYPHSRRSGLQRSCLLPPFLSPSLH